MSFVERLKSRVAEIKEIAQEFKASPELEKTRIEICRACPELKPKLEICGKCGCFMGAKTKIASATCPMGKW